jgi:hypothetical protein
MCAEEGLRGEEIGVKAGLVTTGGVSDLIQELAKGI